MDKKYHFIYITESNFNGKFYIGMHSTDELNDGYIGSGKKLLEDVNEYGYDTYNTRILEFCDNREDLIKRESEIVNIELINNWYCLNMVEGGTNDGLIKRKCYVKGFNQNDYDEASFKYMVKNDIIVMVINSLFEYHIKLGWRFCSDVEVKKHIKKINKIEYLDSVNDFVVSKLTEEKIVNEKQLKWFLNNGWVVKLGPIETRIINKKSKLKSIITNKLMKKHRGQPFGFIINEINKEFDIKSKKII